MFATSLTEKLNHAVAGFTPLPVFICTYDGLGNILVISMSDARPDAVKRLLAIWLQISTDDTLTNYSPKVKA